MQALTRAVGQALHVNPFAPVVPCHRVISGDGSLGGFASGSKRKIALLSKEGVIVTENKVQNFDKIFYRFKKYKKI